MLRRRRISVSRACSNSTICGRHILHQRSDPAVGWLMELGRGMVDNEAVQHKHMISSAAYHVSLKNKSAVGGEQPHCRDPPCLLKRRPGASFSTPVPSKYARVPGSDTRPHAERPEKCVEMPMLALNALFLGMGMVVVLRVVFGIIDVAGGVAPFIECPAPRSTSPTMLSPVLVSTRSSFLHFTRAALRP